MILKKLVYSFIAVGLLAGTFFVAVPPSTNSVNAAGSDWVIDGEKIYIDDEKAYLSAEPHTLQGDGWVEFELLSKEYEGNIDIVLGVDVESNITFSNPQRWKKDAAHDAYIWIPSELQGEITLDNIIDYEWFLIEEFEGIIDLGNENNTYIASVTYELEILPEEIHNNNIAFYDYEWLNPEQTAVKLYYNYDGKVRDWYTEYYDDWVDVNASYISSDYQWNDVSIWYHASLDVPISSEVLYRARVFAKIPFKGLEEISGKYYWAVKPSGETIQQALSNGHLYMLDPWYNASWDYRKEITVSDESADYQTKVLIGKTSDAVGEDVDCGGHIADDFDDLRFTGADGETLLDYWIESIEDSGGTKLATVWVQNNDTPDTTLYMYYSGTETAVSNGANTFILFDNFERGNNGDPIGGDWTIVNGDVDVSDEQAYSGTKSMKLIGNNPIYPYTYHALVASNNQAIRFRYYKESNAQLRAYHGNGSYYPNYFHYDLGIGGSKDNIAYANDSGVQDTGYDASSNAWHLWEINDIDFSGSQNYDIWVDDEKKKNDAEMRSGSSYTDTIYFLGRGDGAYDAWLDDFIVRKWAANEPSFAFGAEETATPDAPTNVSATDGVHESKVVITWTKSDGATKYEVFRDAGGLGELGDVATFDDNGATAGTISNAGTVTASDGTETAYVELSLAGETTGTTTHSYTVKAGNDAGWSDASGADNGNRGVGAITYQWQVDDGGGYDNIIGGTTDPYNYVGAPAGTISNAGTVTASDGTETSHVELSLAGEATTNGASYTYRCIVSSSGASNSPQTSDSDTGYRGVGAITYQWQVDDGGGYDNIVGGTTDPYNYSSAPAGTISNAGTVTASDGTFEAYVALSLTGEATTNGATYTYRCIVSAVDASNTPQTSNTDTGYRGVGAITYQWQRSAGDADAGYGNIAGATTDPYNDVGAPANGDGRYFQCIVSSLDAGNTPQTSDSDRGYRIPVVVVVGEQHPMVLAILIVGAVTLMCLMFVSSNSMLGFPAAIFWFLLGGHAYTLSITAWGDIEYYLFFSSMGLGIFVMFAAFTLRKKDLDNPDIGKEKMIDEKGDVSETEEVKEPDEDWLDERAKKRGKNRRFMKP